MRVDRESDEFQERCPLPAIRHPLPATRNPFPAGSRKPVTRPQAGWRRGRDSRVDRDEFRATAAIFPRPAPRCPLPAGNR
jgi:hypothetical protein